MRICVSKCPWPNATLNSNSELQDYARESSIQLCRYDILYDDYTVDDPEKCPSEVSNQYVKSQHHCSDIEMRLGNVGKI